MCWHLTGNYYFGNQICRHTRGAGTVMKCKSAVQAGTVCNPTRPISFGFARRNTHICPDCKDEGYDDLDD